MKSSPQYTSACLLLILVSFLAACGGGGGGTSTASAPVPASAVAPSAVFSANLALGTPTIASARTNTGYGLASQVTIRGVNVPATMGAPAVNSLDTTASNIQVYPDVHITDTGAAAQWAMGWTGRGTTISVIEDFVIPSVSITNPDPISIPIGSLFPVAQTVNGEPYNIIYAPVLAEELSHGGIASSIAGGGGATPSGDPITSVFLSAVGSSCASTASASCTALSDTALLGLSVLNFPINFNSPAGVAKEARVINKRLSALERGPIFQAIGESLGSTAINLSIGNDLTDGFTFADLRELTASDVFSGRPVNAVIVVAAGNERALCTESNLTNCNGLASELALYPSTANNVIIAGATEGTGENEVIARFSNRAGAFKERFLLAPGATGFLGINGTSFSAPRITGAAALLRQKFPNLSGSDAASVLLLSADKDINNDGTADFSGVSDVYGHGKLDLSSAMSPVGTLAVR